jgi:hypothetical protein
MADDRIIIPIKIINRGGEADRHRLRLLDAGDMYVGLHRAMAYVSLSYIYGELVERATWDSEVQIFQVQTTDNCLIHEIIVEIQSNPAALGVGILGGVVANKITDLFDVCVKAAVGLFEENDSADRQKIADRVEPFFDELVAKTERHIQAIHAPIHSQETIELFVGSLPPIKLDKDTKEFVSTSITSPNPKTYVGSVTRLNLLTGNGRFYCRELGRVVPFSQPREFQRTRGSRRLSWSLRQRDREQSSEIEVTVTEVTTSAGRIKRFIIRSVKRHHPA